MENPFSLMLVLSAVLLCPSAYSYNYRMSYSQGSQYSFPTFGRYRIHGQAPKGFKTFYEFEVRLPPGENPSSAKIDGKGALPIEGTMFVTPAEFRSGTTTERQGEMNASEKVSFVDVVRLRFVSAGLQLEGNRFCKISFVTEAVDGTSYAFEGSFLEKAKLENGGYVELAGNMRKLKAGRKAKNASLKFLRWAYE